MSRAPFRSLLTSIACATGADSVISAFARRVYGPHIRLINYHDTPAARRDAFAAQLAYFRGRYEPARLSDLDDLLATGRWRGGRRPGLLICFDDGLRSNYDVAVPLLEEFGFSGLFFPPVGFLDCPVPEQRHWGREHIIAFNDEAAYPDGRIAMTWDELRSLLPRHDVGAHTRTHCMLSADLTESQLRDEIITAKADLESRIGRPVSSFCWVAGIEESHCAAAARLVQEAGYRFAFSTASSPVRYGDRPLELQRTNIEVQFPMSRVRLALSGAADWHNRRKRAVIGPLMGGRARHAL